MSVILTLDDSAASLARVGGKGASLAKLAAAHFLVPPGFHVTTEAYQRFVAAHRLQDRILNALRAQPDTAAREISALFAAHEMPADIAEAIHRAYTDLGQVPVAVRSSATAEDLPQASFAGQQETFLDVRDSAAVVEAVKRCWASLWTARAIDYRSRHEIAHADVSLAVVVQEMVPADSAGVLFTADPVTGNRERLVINAVRGLGETLVSGEADPHTLVVDRTTRRTIERSGEPVLADVTAEELVDLGLAVERLYARAMDIEWAVAHDTVFIVQARPVTVQAYEEWNDSLQGDYLWTNANLGEAVPDVMTPATWSFVRLFMADGMATSSVPGYLGYGNIGGRFYMNLSMIYSLAAAFGMKRTFAGSINQVFGNLPPELEIPEVPLSRWRVLRALFPVVRQAMKRIRQNTPRIAQFVASSPERCEELRAAIRSTTTPAALADLWKSTIEPFFHESCFMLEAAGRQDNGALLTVRQKLTRLVGEVDMNAMTSGVAALDDELESLGPLLGLARVARGELDREAYARRYGHRSASEFELSTPRPAEDPTWIDRRLAGLSTANEQPDELLARQEAVRRDAWQRFAKRYPRKIETMRRQVARWSKAARDRELTRSETVRAFWVVRDFLLRAGELTGLGDDVFFLDREEILAVLEGDSAVLDSGTIETRRATYERYKALPSYPTLVKGRFDPFRWAADPGRRHDLYDEHAVSGTAREAVAGFPGAAGVVEARVRVLSSVDDSDRLQPGEVLVTTVTNIGWTPIFPMAAAVVTDVGAPLSHAAIVARELGIPAVVGTGNATMRLRTGDLVRVDGGRGTVELLSSGERTLADGRAVPRGEQGDGRDRFVRR